MLTVSKRNDSDLTRSHPLESSKLHHFFWGVATPIICTLLVWPLRFPLGEGGILMIYLLGVFLVANYFGRGPSLLASILSAPLFAFYFAQPIFSFAISDLKNLVGLAIMLIVANLTSNIQNNAQKQADLANFREIRTNALYQLSRELANTSDQAAVVKVVNAHLQHLLHMDSYLFFFDAEKHLIPFPSPSVYRTFQTQDLFQIQPLLESTIQTESLMSLSGNLYYRLSRKAKPNVILFLKNTHQQTTIPSQLHDLIRTFGNLVGQTLDRLHYAEQAKMASIQAETEALRNSLLSSISHDLRTPLTRITGAASSLIESTDRINTHEKQELGKIIFDEARRMSDLTGKILNMARLSRGEIVLHPEWQNLEEIIGSALTRLNDPLQTRPVQTTLTDHLPLIWMDGVLMEQVFINLIENAIKFTPVNSSIELTAVIVNNTVEIKIGDFGPGIPKGMEERVFDKFFSLNPESGDSGVGLGLALCKAIIVSHGGAIHVESRIPQGAIFVISLPMLEPPPFDWIEEPEDLL